MVAAVAPFPGAPIDPRPAFVAALPAVEARARAAFAGVRNYHDREDAVAEVVARTWQAFVAAPGCALPIVIALAAIAAVRAAVM